MTRRARGVLAAVLALSGAGIAVGLTGPGSPATAEDCALRYVAGGDHVPAGHEVSETERFPSQLLEEHLKPSPGPWCVYNTAKNETTSATYTSGGQQAAAWNYRPDLITLTVGGENGTIVDLITKCFDKVKDHDFSGANSCAAVVYGNSSAYTSLKNNLVTTLDYYKRLMAGRPQLVVAVTGYANPYPRSSAASSDVPQLCTPLIDTAQTCNQRWAQLPPALTTLDNAIKKLNTTIEEAVKPFVTGSQGRYFFVNPYDKLRDHCMKMDVTILTTVDHGDYVDAHNSSKNMGCSDPWFVEGSTGSKTPDYLEPASNGVLLTKTQTTVGMGVHPNDKGADCLSDLVWEAVKTKLGVPEPPSNDVCSG